MTRTGKSLLAILALVDAQGGYLTWEQQNALTEAREALACEVEQEGRQEASDP